MILEMLMVGPLASNCYIVGSETTKEGMVIDPSAETEKILSSVNRLGLTITLIVATHCHVDHVGAISEVKEATGAQFAIHEAARPQETIQRYAYLMGPSFKLPPKPDRLLHDGDIIEVGDLRFTVVHTPGHSPDGISLVGHGVVFTGDTLFNLGIGRTDFFDSNYKQLMESIFSKLLVLPDETIVYPGHGPETTIGDERKWNPFLRN